MVSTQTVANTRYSRVVLFVIIYMIVSFVIREDASGLIQPVWPDTAITLSS